MLNNISLRIDNLLLGFLYPMHNPKPCIHLSSFPQGFYQAIYVPHTDISVTSNVYTHLKLEDAQREMERLERIEKEMKSVPSKEINNIGKKYW